MNQIPALLHIRRRFGIPRLIDSLTLRIMKKHATKPPKRDLLFSSPPTPQRCFMYSIPEIKDSPGINITLWWVLQVAVWGQVVPISIHMCAYKLGRKKVLW